MAIKDIYRIGTGAGFSSDRLDPAIDLVARGNLDAIVFECVGERTLAFGHRDRQINPADTAAARVRQVSSTYTASPRREAPAGAAKTCKAPGTAPHAPRRPQRPRAT